MDDVIYGQPQEKSPKTLGKDSSRMHKKFIYCLDDGEYFPIQNNVFASINFFFQKRNFLAFLFSGWVVDNKNRDWEFRISVYYVSDEDTNTYICKTPRGKSNSITVIVTGKKSYFNSIDKFRYFIGNLDVYFGLNIWSSVE